MKDSVQFIGEQLWYGRVGHILAISAFVFAMLACYAFYRAMREPQHSGWRQLGTLSFVVHGGSVIGLAGIIFSIIYQHLFEYYYVWEHSSRALPFRYILSCFWEGQEGSFLVWTFWHVILSVFILRKYTEWTAPVMSVISCVQVFLSSMLLGVYVFGIKIGSSPFVLLREHPEMAKLPFTQMADYLNRIADGRGLNPLLQNYWMVIHPPILFLGFASALIPFAFAISGLLTGRLKEWIKPALPWALFNVALLGAGVLMGAAWAYEALSFGGFWAWDPVENASLVPWLIMVGAVHVMLIQRHRDRSLLSSFILSITSFLLILYSTFLTRSGILGDASVHAFTDLGMSGQLLVYMGFFVIGSVYLWLRHRKNLIEPKGEEESLTSREFWMFIGMLVLVISAFQITLSTSIPVINKILGTQFAPPVDAKAHYNTWQLPIAVVLNLLIAIGQFFKWKDSEFKEILKKLLLASAVAVALTAAFSWQMGIKSPHYIALLFTSLFAMCANIDYFFRTLKGKMKVSGASLAHAGFGLLIAGTLISNSQSKVISRTFSPVDFGKDLPANENLLLEKGDTLLMGDYFVSYKGKEKIGVNIFYEVEYFKYDFAGKKMVKQFSLKPLIQTNPRMGNVSEPDTRHFPTEDIYTHITYADLKEEENSDSLYAPSVTRTVSIGDTIATSKYIVVLKGIDKNIDKEKLHLSPADMAVGANLEITDGNSKTYFAKPVFVIHENNIYIKEGISEETGLKFYFTKIDPETGTFDIEYAEKKSQEKEFIIMKAIIFPWINLLWSGAILMVIGTLVAVRKRYLKTQKA